MEERKVILRRIRRVSRFCKKNIKNHNEEVVADMVQYLCILAYLYFEQSIEYTISCYVEKNTNNQTIKNFVIEKSKEHRGLKPHELIGFLGQFSGKWKSSIKERFKEFYQESESLESLIASRNNVAHGRSIALTFNQIKEYRKQVNKIVKFINKMVNDSDSHL